MFERPPFDDDRSFTAWLEQDAQLRPPDALLGQVLSRTAATRRRPAWLVIERWFPMDTTARFGAIPRTAIVLLTLGLLVLLATAIAAGSQPRLPQPFGPAGNGNIVYSVGGDIYLADPDGSDARPIVTGPANDRYPSFSRDGTRMMFGRGDENDLALMIAMADGTGVTELASGVQWADFMPDGSQVFAIHSVDGKMRALPLRLSTAAGRSSTSPTGEIEPLGLGRRPTARWSRARLHGPPSPGHVRARDVRHRARRDAATDDRRARGRGLPGRGPAVHGSILAPGPLHLAGWQHHRLLELGAGAPNEPARKPTCTGVTSTAARSFPCPMPEPMAPGSTSTTLPTGSGWCSRAMPRRRAENSRCTSPRSTAAPRRSPSGPPSRTRTATGSTSRPTAPRSAHAPRSGHEHDHRPRDARDDGRQRDHGRLGLAAPGALTR